MAGSICWAGVVVRGAVVSLPVGLGLWFGCL